MNLVWHRGDLRIHDHPALEAAARGAAVGLVILDPRILETTSPRRRAMFLAHVQALREQYRSRGGELFVRDGVPELVLPRFVVEAGIQEIFALRSYTPYGLHRDNAAQRSTSLRWSWHSALYVHEPGSIKSFTEGKNYTVFAPFYRRWRSIPIAPPSDTQARLTSPPKGLRAGEIPASGSEVELPYLGEAGALLQLDRFLRYGLERYGSSRDRLDGSGSSGLSMAINLGSLSAREAARRALATEVEGAEVWLRELAWRDFMADLLWHRPDMLECPFERRWQAMRWNEDSALFQRWCEGRTGVPPVDAAMRQLNATGLLSNRARMLAAQFASKHLLLPWRWGEAQFKRLLLDGDTAQNVGNWQWASGLGVDAAPYFRVFNPVTQAQQHDPDGAWVKRWVPESGGDPQPREGAAVDLKQARRRYLDLARELSRR